MDLPRIRPYGRYSSHCLNVHTNGMDLYFSYQTLVAFRSYSGRLVVHQNDWGTTTGKHLNAIDGGNKRARVNAEEFQRLWEDETRQKVVARLEG